jgi:hypothetical protein
MQVDDGAARWRPHSGDDAAGRQVAAASPLHSASALERADPGPVPTSVRPPIKLTQRFPTKQPHEEHRRAANAQARECTTWKPTGCRSHFAFCSEVADGVGVEGAVEVEGELTQCPGVSFDPVETLVVEHA